MSIKVNNITKYYNDFCAVKDLSFELKKGEVVGFLGPNGAGKSTTMKIITGYLSPSKGSVDILEESMSQDRLDLKKRIGYLPEQNPLYTNMYIKEYLNFVASIHKMKSPVERVEEIINITGLTKERNKKIAQLSKGYRQRVGLAQSLIHDPDILILDEPASGLDPNQIIEIRQLIKELGKDKTVILSSHILQEVKAICSRVIIINQGQKVFDESMADINDDLEKIFFELTMSTN